MFINLTNHPSDKWSGHQLLAAHQYGEIIDLPFPSVPEYASHEDNNELAKNIFEEVEKISFRKPCVVHIMGEMTFTYALVKLLKSRGYTCVASTTKRNVDILPDGTKNVKFEFCQFREY